MCQFSGFELELITTRSHFCGVYSHANQLHIPFLAEYADKLHKFTHKVGK
jgi:hypothetical protein